MARDYTADDRNSRPFTRQRLLDNLYKLRPESDPNQLYPLPLDEGSRPAMPGERGAPQYRGQDVRVAQNQNVMSDAGPQGQKTMLFLHGMESRYGKTKPAQLEAQAQRYAEKRGMKFEAIPISGDNKRQQFKAAQQRVKQGGVGAVLGFSAGGYTAAKLHAPGVEKIILGAPGATGNKTFPGRHMDQVKSLSMGFRTPPPSQADYKAFGFKSPPQGASSNRVIGGGGARYSPNDFFASRGGHSTTNMRQGAPGSAGLNREFAGRLYTAAAAYEASTGKRANFGEMDRDAKTQAVYYDRYKHGTGGLAAPPGRSRHNIGQAVDVPRGAFNDWLHTHGQKYGLEGIRGDRPHIQLARGYQGQTFADRAPSGPSSPFSQPSQLAPETTGAQGDLNRAAGLVSPKTDTAAAAQQTAAPHFPPQPPPVSTGIQGAVNRTAGLPTVKQLIDQNIKKPEFAPYAQYTGMIPDQHLPADKWMQQHRDLYNSPMVPQPVKAALDSAIKPAAPAAQQTPGSAPGASQVPMPSARPPEAPQMLPQQTAQLSPQQQQGPLSTAGNPLNVPQHLTPSETGAIRQQQQIRGIPQPPQQGIPLPTPRPGAAPQIGGQEITPQQQRQIQQPGAQPAPVQPDNIMMPPTPGGQPNNTMPVRPGPQMNMGGAPMSPNVQPGMSGGTPFLGGGSPFTMDWALPANRQALGGAGVGGWAGGGMGGGGLGFSGMGGGSGMMGGGGMAGGGMGGGGGPGGGGMGGGGGGHGVNLSGAIAMIPKPIDISQSPRVDHPINAASLRPMQPTQQGGSVAQDIMQFLQG